MPAYRLTLQDAIWPAAALPAGAWAGECPWLLPSFIFGELHAAWQRAFPQVQLWEHTHPSGQGGQYANRNERSQRFGSLATVGPFPCVDVNRQSAWQFPAPKDVARAARTEIAFPRLLRREAGTDNLPPPLQYVLGDSQKAQAHGVKGWWSKQAIEDYLHRRAPRAGEMRGTEELYSVEGPGGRMRRWQARAPADDAAGGGNTETAADQGVHAAGPLPSGRVPEDVQLRLADSVSLGFHAFMPLQDAGHAEGMERLIPPAGRGWVTSRRQRAGRIEVLEVDGLERWLPLSAPVEGERVKWLLLTPAIFPRVEANLHRGIAAHPGGWLPNWVCPETGQVRLRKGETGRFILSRESWREKVRALPPFDCRLVAAAVPPPLVVLERSDQPPASAPSGEAGWGWQPACHAVAAGAVYYFEGPDAGALAAALAWHGELRQNLHQVRHRRSARLGEQGYGIGVCGPWEF